METGGSRAHSDRTGQGLVVPVIEEEIKRGPRREVRDPESVKQRREEIVVDRDNQNRDDP